jgi:hypothetical protein
VSRRNDFVSSPPGEAVAEARPPGDDRALPPLADTDGCTVRPGVGEDLSGRLDSNQRLPAPKAPMQELRPVSATMSCGTANYYHTQSDASSATEAQGTLSKRQQLCYRVDVLHTQHATTSLQRSRFSPIARRLQSPSATTRWSATTCTLRWRSSISNRDSKVGDRDSSITYSGGGSLGPRVPQDEASIEGGTQHTPFRRRNGLESPLLVLTPQNSPHLRVCKNMRTAPISNINRITPKLRP